MIHNKLVRDRIPAIIRERNQTSVTHVADNPEYQQRLLAKLQEEAAEFVTSEAIEELANVLEVIHAICAFRNIDLAELEAIRLRKAVERGGFAQRLVLDEVH